MKKLIYVEQNFFVCIDHIYLWFNIFLQMIPPVVLLFCIKHIAFKMNIISVRIQMAQSSTREIRDECPPVVYHMNMNHNKRNHAKAMSKNNHCLQKHLAHVRFSYECVCLQVQYQPPTLQSCCCYHRGHIWGYGNEWRGIYCSQYCAACTAAGCRYPSEYKALATRASSHCCRPCNKRRMCINAYVPTPTGSGHGGLAHRTHHRSVIRVVKVLKWSVGCHVFSSAAKGEQRKHNVGFCTFSDWLLCAVFKGVILHLDWEGRWPLTAWLFQTEGRHEYMFLIWGQ